MNEIKSIIFDLGGVILSLDYSKTVDEFKKIDGAWCFSKREIRNSITGDMCAHLKIPSLTIPSAKDKKN